jgi:hypothetical protein
MSVRVRIEASVTAIVSGAYPSVTLVVNPGSGAEQYVETKSIVDLVFCVPQKVVTVSLMSYLFAAE